MREATLIGRKIQLNFLILIVWDFLNPVRWLSRPLFDGGDCGNGEEG